MSKMNHELRNQRDKLRRPETSALVGDMGRSFKAKYPGVCKWCDKPFKVGQPICGGHRGYMHERCSRISSPTIG